MEAFIGTVLAVGFNYAPRGWAFCNGQLMSIQQNTALFALLGTMYGGDGQTTFGVPDLRGRTIFGSQGQGPGIAPILQGEKSGTNTATVISSGSTSFTLSTNNLPQHTHGVTVPGSAFTVSSTLQVSKDTTGANVAQAGAMLCSTGAAGQTQAAIYETATPAATSIVALAANSVVSTLVGNAGLTSASAGSGTAVAAPVSVSGLASIMPPFIGLNYIICVEGLYPSRN